MHSGHSSLQGAECYENLRKCENAQHESERKAFTGRLVKHLSAAAAIAAAAARTVPSEC
jgi:hypothetical protein